MEDRTLEPTPEQFRAWTEQALQYLVEYLEQLPDRPAWQEAPSRNEVVSMLESLPSKGEPFDRLLGDFFGRFLEDSYNPASPGYLAYIPGGGLPHAAIADLIANTINHYVGVWCAAPWLAQIEQQVIRWLCEMMGLPASTSGGFLTTGGSLASWSGITAARQILEPFPFDRATVYVSQQAHHCIAKGAQLAGISGAHIRAVEVDDRLRIEPAALRKMIDEDRAKGLAPWLLVGQAGTTNTGAVDDLSALAEIARQERLWYHVDAAYGGFFMLTERGEIAMRGIEQADSVVLDPHKGMFAPYGNGCLLVRDARTLHRTFRMTSDYMPAMQDDLQAVDFCDVSPELSRDFRGLRLWLPIKMHGIDPFRHNLNEKLDLARWVADELQALATEFAGRIRVIAPQLSVVAFRYESPRLSVDELNQINTEWLEKINASRRVFLTPTMLDGRRTLRVCILSFRTHRDRVTECLELIRNSARELFG